MLRHSSIDTLNENLAALKNMKFPVDDSHSDKNKNAFSQNFSTNNRKINSHFSSLNENKESQICPLCDGTI